MQKGQSVFRISQIQTNNQGNKGENYCWNVNKPRPEWTSLYAAIEYFPFPAKLYSTLQNICKQVILATAT